MNESGKSDKPVVPTKPAKTDSTQSFRELFERVKRVEGRGLAKENEECGQTALLPVGPAKQVDRTLSRVEEGKALDEDLSSALDRVRQAGESG